MLRVVVSLLAVNLTSRRTIAMRKCDVVAEALVRFHWSESNKRKNYTEDLRQRADALDGQLATIMNPPEWFNNSRRIVIESLEFANITLAVKRRNLELIQPIKIHVFHAKNDTSISDQYLQKEMRILHDSNYSAVMTVHPFTNSSEWHIGSCVARIRHQWHSDFLNALDMFYRHELLTHSQFDLMNIVEELKTKTKSIISWFVWSQYRITNGSHGRWTEYLSWYDPVFRTTLQCQFGKIAQNNGTYTNMEWWKNDKITMRWMAQAMFCVFDAYHIESKMKLKTTRNLSSAESVIQRILFRIIKAVADHGNIESHIAMQQLVRNLCGIGLDADHELLASPSRKWPLFIRELKSIPEHVAKRMQSITAVAMLRNIGEKFLGILQSLEYGDKIAIVVPGDFMPKVDLLENFLYRSLRKLGLKYQSEFEIFNI